MSFFNKGAAAAGLAGALTVFASCGGASELETLSGEALVVDVRSPGEFSRGHFPGALNIPVGALGSRLDELGPRDREIVVYCRSGNRSGRAKRILIDAGFTDVKNGGGLSEMMRFAPEEK